MKTELGDLAKDRITGYTGIVVAVTDWLNKCRRITLQARALKDGKPVESATFDETDVVLVKADALSTTKKRSTGGPPTRAADPIR